MMFILCPFQLAYLFSNVIGMYHVLLDARWRDQSFPRKWHTLLKNYMKWVALKFPLVTQLELVHQVIS